jgi:hypothetical protein
VTTSVQPGLAGLVSVARQALDAGWTAAALAANVDLADLTGAELEAGRRLRAARGHLQAARLVLYTPNLEDAT